MFYFIINKLHYEPEYTSRSPSVSYKLINLVTANHWIVFFFLKPA